jgi:SAM-dependent methyltransferase
MAQATIQTVQEYWDARPCNIRHSDKAVGSREYFDEVEKRKYFVEPHIPEFAEFARWSGRRVLEVGCGIGTDTINFARAGALVTAVDLSGKSVALASSRARLFGLAERIQFFQADAENLADAVPREEYDLVYSFGVIHHTPHPRKAIESIRQYMTARSEFRLMIYAADSWKATMIDAGFDQPEAQSGCPIAHTYTLADARELLAGFEILDMRQDHIFPYAIGKYVRYEYELQPWFKCMPVEMFRALERRFGWHLLIRAKLS